MSKIKLVIFDLDGTLIDTDSLVINSYRHVFETYRPDYKLTREEEISFLGPTLISMFPKYFKEDFNVLLKTYREYGKKTNYADASLYDGVLDMLASLKERDILLAVVTSRYYDAMKEIMGIFPLDNYFDYYVSLDDVSKPKPNPEGILKVLKHFNVKKEEAIYVGDNESDYLAGKESGVLTALVTWARGRDNSLLNPNILINSFNEFIDQIEKI